MNSIYKKVASMDRIQYHATSWSRVPSILREGLRLPTAPGDVSTHRYKIPSISTSPKLDDVNLYGGAILKLRVRPGSKYLKRSFRRHWRRGETLEDVINRWLREAKNKGYDGVELDAWTSTVGHQTLQPEALEVMGVVNPEDAPDNFREKIHTKVASKYLRKKQTSSFNRRIEDLRGLLYDSSPDFKKILETLRFSGYDPALIQYIYEHHPSNLVQVSNSVFRETGPGKRKDIQSFFEGIDGLGLNPDSKIGKTIFQNCWKFYYIRYIEDKHKNLNRFRSFSYSFEKLLVTWKFIPAHVSVTRLSELLPDFSSPLRYVTQITLKYDPNEMSIVTLASLGDGGLLRGGEFKISESSFEATFRRCWRLVSFFLERIYYG